MGFSFQYRTRVEKVELGHLSLSVECLESLEATIDELFREYERTGREDLFEEMCPYFGNVWPAGVALAKEALHEARNWKDRRVLEIGCGLGIPSLALLRSGCPVVSSDIHPDVPVFLRRNSERNGVEEKFILADWKSPDSLPGSWDVILASDVLYDRRQVSELIVFLKNRLSPDGLALLADPGRPCWEPFVQEVRRSGWCVEEGLRHSIFFARLTRRNQ